MESRSNNKDIVISIAADSEEKKDEKIETILQICSQYEKEDSDITICIQGIESESFEERLRQSLGNNIGIVRLDSFEKQLEFYEESLASKWYHITDSPTGIKEAILSIQRGILPIVFSFPNEELSYIDNIQDLYLDILQIELKIEKGIPKQGDGNGTHGEDSEIR